MSNYGSFWQEVVSGGGPGPDPTPTLTIAWDADQVSGENGRFVVEMPTGTVGNATGLWTDSDASAAEPVDEIYFTLDRETFELGTALTGAAETTVQVGRAPGPNVPPRGTLRITDDAGAYRELPYSSFTGSAFTLTSAADFSVTGASVNNAVGVLGRRIEVTSNSSFETTAGTWGLTHSDFALTDDAQPMISYITDFDGNKASASVLFLLDHQDPLQALDVPAPTRHPNFRDASSGLDWDFTTAYSTPIPDWEWDDEATQYQLTTTGYGGHVKIPASFLAPTMRLVVSANSEYAGKACEPRFSVAVPEDKTIWFEVTHVRGVTTTTNSYSWAGPIDWTGNPSELNITLPKVELEANDRLDIRVWATGAGALDPLWQYSDHRVVEQGADVPFTDPYGVFVDPDNPLADDATAEFGNPNKPWKSHWGYRQTAKQAAWPTPRGGGPINVYQPRGSVSRNGDGTNTGDACVFKYGSFHLQPLPGSSGQAPVIDAAARFPLTSDSSAWYGKLQFGAMMFRACTNSTVEEFIVRDSWSVGISAECDQLSPFGVSDGITIKNCIVDRSGSDGILLRGYQAPSERPPASPTYVWPANTIKNVTIKNVIVKESAYAMQGTENISGHPDETQATTGQAITTSLLEGGLIEDCKAIDFRKEGFDAISSRNVTFRRCYAERAADTPYGTQRGANFYTDSSQEGCRDILFEQCTSAGGSAAFRITSEGGGEMIRVKFSTCWAWGGTAAPIGFSDESQVGVVVEDSGFEHCTVLNSNNQFAVVDTMGSPVVGSGDIFIRNCILVSNRRDIISSQNSYTNWDVDGNVFFSTTGTITDSVSELGTNYVVDVDPQFVSSTDLTPQNAAMLGQITPPIRTVNINNHEVADPDNYGAY